MRALANDGQPRLRLRRPEAILPSWGYRGDGAEVYLMFW